MFFHGGFIKKVNKVSCGSVLFLNFFYFSRHLTTRTKELDTSKNTITKCLGVVKELLIEKSRIERKDARAKCMQNRLRLGQFVTQRVGASFQENWTDGYAFQELSKRQEEIAVEREEIDKRKKLLAKRKPVDSNGPGHKRRAQVGYFVSCCACEERY